MRKHAHILQKRVCFLIYYIVPSSSSLEIFDGEEEEEKDLTVSQFKNHSHTMSIATIGISLSSLPNVRKRLREEIKFSSSSLSSEDDSLSNENGECSSVSNSCPPRKRRRRTRYENDRIFMKLKK